MQRSTAAAGRHACRPLGRPPRRSGSTPLAGRPLCLELCQLVTSRDRDDGRSPSAAARATRTGPLPRKLCASNEPSPTMTRSAEAATSSKPVSSRSSSAPETRRAPAMATSPKPRPPAAPAPGRSRMVLARRHGDRVRPCGQSTLERRHALRVRALLRCVDSGGPGRTQQGVVDVAGDDDVDSGEASVESAARHCGTVRLLAKRSHVDPQRLDGACSAVGCRASPRPDDDLAWPRDPRRRG